MKAILKKALGSREAGAEGVITKHITQEGNDLYRVEFADGVEPHVRWLFEDEVNVR